MNWEGKRGQKNPVEGRDNVKVFSGFMNINNMHIILSFAVATGCIIYKRATMEQSAFSLLIPNVSDRILNT